MENHANSNNGALITVRELDGTIYADSRDIARGLDIEHTAFIATIDKHKQLIESEFGEKVLFQKGPSRGRNNATYVTRYAALTEDQAIYIGTLSRNSPTVLRFKAALVKAFRDARRALEKVPAQEDGMKRAFHIIQSLRPCSLTNEDIVGLLEKHQEVVGLAIGLSKENKQINAQVRQLTLENQETTDLLYEARPVVEAYETFLEEDEADYSWTSAAKSLARKFPGMGHNRLVRILRDERVLIDGGKNHNTPYQRYVEKGYFRVYFHPDHEGPTTAVKKKGLDFLFRKLAKIRGRESAQPARLQAASLIPPPTDLPV